MSDKSILSKYFKSRPEIQDNEESKLKSKIPDEIVIQMVNSKNREIPHENMSGSFIRGYDVVKQHCPHCGNESLNSFRNECSNNHLWIKCKKHQHSYIIFSKYNYYFRTKKEIDCNDTCVKA